MVRAFLLVAGTLVGLMLFTRIEWGASSAASVRIKPFTPCLDAE